MAASREEIYTKVKGVLSDALGVDEDEVSPDATLQSDLGAESIDYLDIVFRLEKTFSIEIPKGDLFPDDLMGNPDYVEGGKVTALGIAKLKEAMPHADLSQFEDDPDVSKVSDLFTVNTIVNYVQRKLSAA